MTESWKVVRWISLFYGLLGLAGLGLWWWRHDPDQDFFPLGPGIESLFWPGLGVSVAIVLVVVGLSRWLERIWPAVPAALRDIRETLGPMTRLQVFLLAFFSSVGEELFFRAYLQMEIGLIAASVLFGLVHLPPNARWRLWPLFAIAMGFVLGLTYQWTQSLWFPILIHAGINYANLYHALRKDEGRRVRDEIN